jgi:hypothetical protein
MAVSFVEMPHTMRQERLGAEVEVKLSTSDVTNGHGHEDKAPLIQTPNSTVQSLVKLTATQVVKKLSSFYGTRRFITAFISVFILSQMNPVNIITPYLLKVKLSRRLRITPL